MNREQGLNESEIEYIIAHEPVLQHSYASASSVAWAMYQKFVQVVPLYRQEKGWRQMGFPISHATLSNWIMKLYEKYGIIRKSRTGNNV